MEEKRSKGGKNYNPALEMRGGKNYNAVKPSGSGPAGDALYDGHSPNLEENPSGTEKMTNVVRGERGGKLITLII
jgi:hypothetical protein